MNVSRELGVAQHESELLERFLHQFGTEFEEVSLHARLIATALWQRFHSVIWLASAVASDLILERRQFNY